LSPITIAGVVDLVIVVEWAVVALYFLRRWFQHRRLVSFCLAAMALGWLLFGLQAHWMNVELAKGVALGLGAVLWFAIWRVEREASTSR